MENYKAITMPFGKYKGRFVWEISDVNYFQWLYNTQRFKLKGEILKAVKFKIGKN